MYIPYSAPLAQDQAQDSQIPPSEYETATSESKPIQKEALLFEAGEEIYNVRNQLLREFSDKVKISISTPANLNRDEIGFALEFTDKQGGDLLLSTNEDGEHVLIGPDYEIIIPASVLKDATAIGHQQLNQVANTHSSQESDKLQQEFSETNIWSSLVSQAKGSATSISFIDTAAQTIIEAKKQHPEFNLDDQRHLDQALVEFALNQGFLNDGTIQPHEAALIADYINSEEFEQDIEKLQQDYLEDKKELANALPNLMERWTTQSGKDELDSWDILELLKDESMPDEERHFAQMLINDSVLFEEIASPLELTNQVISKDEAAQFSKRMSEENDQFELPAEELVQTPMQAAYFENRGHFKTIFESWDKWNGKDEIVSKADLDKIAKYTAKKGEEPKYSDKEIAAAQFLIDHQDILDSMDQARDKNGLDTKISTYDLQVWIKDNDVFGKNFRDENIDDLKTIASSWDKWTKWVGNDTIVSEDDLHKISTDKSNTFSQAEKEAAAFLLDNSDFLFYLDIQGMQSSSDFKIGTDYLDLQDGMISDNFKQAHEGNCWVLTGLYSLAQNPVGAQAIENSIRPGDNGNYFVTFKGDPEQKEYEVTAEDLKNNKFTKDNSDIDMRIMNVAIDHFYKDRGTDIGRNDTIGDGGYSYLVYRLVTGAGTKLGADSDIDHQWFADNAEAINQGALVASIGADVDGSGNIVKRDPDNPRGHAFTILNVDTEKQMIQYSNPWKPKVVREISFKDFDEKVENRLQVYYRDFDTAV